MLVRVTCTIPECTVAMATENVKLVLEFGTSSSVKLTEVTKGWDEGHQGRTVIPSLGTAFSYQQPSVNFAVKGNAKVSRQHSGGFCYFLQPLKCYVYNGEV